MRNSGERLRRVSATALLLVALGATGAVYYPVTRTYFFADDFVCLLRIVEWRLAHFLMAPFGGHILLVRNLVFYIWYVAFGLWPEPYHWAVFVTHLINVWLLFRVIRAFTGDPALACLGAAAWGTSPLGVGTLGWYSVYGHVLVATVLLVVLGDLARRGTPSFRRAAGWCLLLIAGTTCFGVGVGVALVFPLSFLLLAPEAFRDRRLRTLMLALPFAVVALYFAYRRLSTLIAPLPLPELIVVHVGLTQLGPILEMTVHLLGSAIAGLVLGFHFSAADYPGRASSYAIGAYIAALAAALATGDTVLRRRLLALLLLSAGAFGIIAIGRANLSAAQGYALSAFVNSVRYYYAGLLPLAVIACLVLQHGCAALGRGTSCFVLAVWLVITTSAFRRATWSIDPRTGFRHYVESSAHSVDAIIDAAAPGTDVYIPNRPLPYPMLGTVLVPGDFPGLAALFVLSHPDDVVRGRRVHFVESDAALLATVRHGDHPRLNRLLVAPTDRRSPSGGR